MVLGNLFSVRGPPFSAAFWTHLPQIVEVQLSMLLIIILSLMVKLKMLLSFWGTLLATLLDHVSMIEMSAQLLWTSIRTNLTILVSTMLL
jgi:hypothetical protein